jgi:hypothetical protein
MSSPQQASVSPLGDAPEVGDAAGRGLPGASAGRDGVRAGVLVVRLWAAAKAAAGVGEVALEVDGPVSVSWVREALLNRAPDRDRLARVLQVCSVLVGDRPLGAADPDEAVLAPGTAVEFLPPFAGG